MSGPLLRGARVVGRTGALVVGILLLAPLQVAVLAVSRGSAAMVLPRWFHRWVCAVLGIRVEVRGTPASSGRAVYLSNHLSHLDIPAIGSVLSACFVAKDDIRGWPVFGTLAGLQQTVFISRDPRRAGEAAPRLRAALDAGHRLVLFPEGTTSDGSAVLPFKSSIFAMLVDPTLFGSTLSDPTLSDPTLSEPTLSEPTLGGITPGGVTLQPMTIELLDVDGVAPADGGNRDGYAYYGDMRMGPHLLSFMRLSGARLRLTFHEPLPQQADRSRKVLAGLAHARVAEPIGRASATMRSQGS